MKRILIRMQPEWCNTTSTIQTAWVRCPLSSDILCGHPPWSL